MTSFSWPRGDNEPARDGDSIAFDGRAPESQYFLRQSFVISPDDAASDLSVLARDRLVSYSFGTRP
ncbi:MAG: hypothetical protein QOG67_1191 [Verrucomicrobiota bacterium]|jgi:hypothetical protein